MSLLRWIVAAFLGFLLLAIGFGIGWFASNGDGQSTIGRTLVLDWGDMLNKDGTVAVKGLYGAHAFATRDADGYSVTARIYIDRPDALFAYFHDCGVIGHAKTLAEAQERWGKVTWTQEPWFSAIQSVVSVYPEKIFSGTADLTPPTRAPSATPARTLPPRIPASAAVAPPTPAHRST